MKSPEKKTLCDSRGHIWVPTASPLIDRCCRSGCHAMRQYKNSQWVEAQSDQPKTPLALAAQQTELWT